MGKQIEQLNFDIFDDQKKAKSDFTFSDKTELIIPKVIPSPVKVFTANRGRSRAGTLQWEDPEFDLAECGRILDTESFVRRAFRNKKNLFVKEGFELVGAKPEHVRYVKKRLRQMEEATKVPFKMLISTLIWSLIRTSNAFLVKVRNEKASGGKIRELPGGRTIKPIAGYFVLAPETVRFKRDEYGKIKKYCQHVFGKEEKEFNPEDVIHFYFDKREGFAVGTPSLVPVKDDIRALRRIEENVELLVYQHLFPLFHYTVGTDKQPAQVYADGTDEVSEVQYKVAQMPSDGCWVTPERHKLEAVGAKGSVVAVDKVITHFKQRIFTGLGNSTVDMGEGGTANNSTAQTMSRNLIDDTKADQKEFATQFEAFVVRELMLESTFPQEGIFDEENEVYLRFKEIDFESRQAKENHLVDIYLKNAITHDEMRTGMGYEPFEGEGWPTENNKNKMFVRGDGDWGKTNYGVIERDKVLIQSVDEPWSETSQQEAKSRTGANTAKAKEPAPGGNSVANKNMPANQHGVRSSTKVNKDSVSKVPSLDIVFNQTQPLQSTYSDLASDVEKSILKKGYRLSEIKLLLNSGFSTASDKLISLAQKAYRVGLQDAGVEPWEVKSQKAYDKINDHVAKYVKKLEDEVYKQIERHLIKSKDLNEANAVFANLIFGSLKHRSAMIDNSEIMKAYNYGKASGYRVKGFDTIISKRHGSDACTTCDKYFLKYKGSDDIIFEELPPLHPNCTCTMERKA